jgi:hypothetical protein
MTNSKVGVIQNCRYKCEQLQKYFKNTPKLELQIKVVTQKTHDFGAVNF